MSAPTAARPVGIRAALRRYRSAPPGIRLFVLARHLLAPLERIAAHVPAGGPLLDVGCGHGLFANLLALQSPERDVLGIDPSKAKIAVARRASAGLPNVQYFEGYLQQLDRRGFRTITILDVLYLLPDVEKLALLKRCRALIVPDGLLLLKTNDLRPRWKYAVTQLQEQLMTGLGLTLGGGSLHFRGADQYIALLRQAGFRCRDALDLGNWQPYPHRLFVAEPLPDHTGRVSVR